MICVGVCCSDLSFSCLYFMNLIAGIQHKLATWLLLRVFSSLLKMQFPPPPPMTTQGTWRDTDAPPGSWTPADYGSLPGKGRLSFPSPRASFYPCYGATGGYGSGCYGQGGQGASLPTWGQGDPGRVHFANLHDQGSSWRSFYVGSG